MIDPSECFVAPISAAKSMTLVLPRSENELLSLILPGSEKPIAIILDELRQFGRFMSFECSDDVYWKGLHIPGVRIELDETSLHDAERHYAPLGSMVRQEDKLVVWVQFEGSYQTKRSYVTVYDGLHLCPPHMSACFLKWQIVLGEGQEKRVLWNVDATPTAD